MLNSTGYVIKQLVHAFSCKLSSYALKKLELPSATPRATFTLLSCSPNFPRASITRYTHAKHEPILNDITQGWEVLQSLISPSKGNEKKKLLRHVVFVIGHSSRCERRRTGLNFVEWTRRDAVLVV